MAILILAATVVSGCAITPLTKKLPSPNLAVDHSVYDFQYAGPTQTITHEFKFTNTGIDAVSIKSISVCCGCDAQTSETLNTAIIPGQQGKIMITCTLPRYEGPVEKVVTVHTNTPDGDPIALTMRGNVERDVVLVPSALSFGTLGKGQKIQKRLRVLQMSNEKLVVKKVTTSSDVYEIKTARFDDVNHRGVELTVDFTANVHTGTYSDVITIHTNDRRRLKIDVPIVAQVVE